MATTRLEAIRAAHFRATVKAKGGSLCRICKGKTRDEEPYCFRHYRRIPAPIKGQLKRGEIDLASIDAMLRAPHALITVEGRYVTPSGHFSAYHQPSDRGGGVVLLGRDGKTVGHFRDIADTQRWIYEHNRTWSVRNRMATKTLIW